MEHYNDLELYVKQVESILEYLEDFILSETGKTLNTNSFLVDYKIIRIPKKKSSEKRIILIPPKFIQFALCQFLPALNGVYNFFKPKNVFGYVSSKALDKENCNIKINAEKHISQEWVLNFDLLNFFSSVKEKKVVNLFSSPPFNLSENNVRIIKNLTTYNGELPTGACTSPVLSNLVFINVDNELNEFSLNNNLVYTRYSDDLTFSSNEKPSSIVINSLISIITKNGYEINYRKYNLNGKNKRQEVTGLVVNEKINVKREYYKLLTAILYNLRKDYKNNSDKYIDTYRHQYNKYLRNRINKSQSYQNYKNAYKKDFQFQDFYKFDVDAKFIPDLFYSVTSKDHFLKFSLKGKIKFIQFIVGKHDPKVLKLWRLFDSIYEPEIFGSKQPVCPSKLEYIQNANIDIEGINASIRADIAYITNATAKSVVYYAYLYLKHNKIQELEILKLINECSKNDKLDFNKLKDKFLYQAASFISLYDYLKSNNRFQNFIESNINSGGIEEIVEFWETKKKNFLPKFYRQIFHERKDCENITSHYNEKDGFYKNTNIFALEEKGQFNTYIVTKAFLLKLGMRICSTCQVSDKVDILHLLS